MVAYWLPNSPGICRSRQAQMLLAQGLDIKRAILAFWVGYPAAELKPLYLRLGD
jgi:hypothetical protein